MIKTSTLDVSSPATKEKQQTTNTLPVSGFGPGHLEHLATEIKEVTTLYNIGVAAGSSLDLNEVIWALYKESGHLIDTANFAVTLCADECSVLSFKLVFDQSKQVQPFLVRRTEKGLTSRVLTSQSPVMVADVLETHDIAETDQIRSNFPIRSWLGVPILNPLLTHESTLGVISTWSYHPNAFDDHTLWLLSAIGTQAAIAIRNAQSYEASQRRAREMAMMNDVARTLSSTLNLHKVLTLIMEQVDNLLNVEAGSLLLTDKQTGSLVFQVALGDKADEIKPFQVPKGQGIAGEVALTGKPAMVVDTQQDNRHFKKFDKDFDFETRNILCVPLILYDEVIGVLEVMNKREGDFTQQDLETLGSVASYAAIAIDNARLLESVLAERDRVIEVEEEARKQLARDLHDGPTQLVAGLVMRVDFCKQALEKDPSLLPNEFDQMREVAEKASHQLRTALFELRPLVLETKGLGAALETFIERRQKDNGSTPKLVLKIETPNPDGEISRQDGKVEATIFAIVQETVNNAVKHASAGKIIINIKETAQAIYAQVRDDGQGFDVDQVMRNYEQRGSLGMVNLRERAELIGGELTMRSTPGRGTQITLYVPKERAERQRRRGVTGTLTMPTNMLAKE
jgi:signal transduction histidine kinase